MCSFAIYGTTLVPYQGSCCSANVLQINYLSIFHMDIISGTMNISGDAFLGYL